MCLLGMSSSIHADVKWWWMSPWKYHVSYLLPSNWWNNHVSVYTSAAHSGCIMIIFLWMTYERHPITHLWGRGMGCHSWLQVWPIFGHCNFGVVCTIKLYITATYQESTVSSPYDGLNWQAMDIQYIPLKMDAILSSICCIFLHTSGLLHWHHGNHRRFVWHKGTKDMEFKSCYDCVDCRCHPDIYLTASIPNSKIHGANMGPTWVLSAPDGPHVGPMNPAIRNAACMSLW